MKALTNVPVNSAAWISIGEFLDAQWLATFGLKRVARPAGGGRSEAADTRRAGEAPPVGNTGGTSQPLLTWRGALAPFLSGASNV